MAFDTSSQLKFSLLPNTLLENPIKPNLGNGFADGESSAKLFSGHNSHHQIGSSHFTIEGSSMNPFSGLQNPVFNRFEYLQPLSSGDGSASAAAGALPLADMGASGLVHELLNKGIINTSQGMNQMYWPTIFGESGNTSFLEDFWYFTPQNGYENRLDLKMKKKRRVQTRRAGRLRKKHVVKGQWTPQEDCLLIQMVVNYGEKKWSEISKHLNGRVGKQCRERWHNHLRPNIKKDPWTEEEDKILIQAHIEIGNRWAEISKRLPGRTENTIKNHWNATKRRHLSAKGCKSPESSLLQNYVKQLFSSPAAATNRQLKARLGTKMVPAPPPITNQQFQWADEQLAPNYYGGGGGLVDTSFEPKMFWENGGFLKSNCSEGFYNATESLLDETLAGNYMIPDGGNIMGLDMPVDMDTLMQFGGNKEKASLLDTIANLNI